MKNYTAAYLLARLVIGMSMFSHGFIRIIKLPVFSAGMTSSYEHSLLPVSLVKSFSLVLPFAELIIGILLLIGMGTRVALIAGVLLMMVLIFGTGILEHWDAIPAQLIHAAYFLILLVFIDHNKYAVDSMLQKNKRL